MRLTSTRDGFGTRCVALLARAANHLWTWTRPAPSTSVIHPEWAPQPLLRRAERSRPPLGWPRETDSLCPDCVRRTRELVITGQLPMGALLEANPGQIRARIVENAGKILMRKRCPVHGEFEDVISTDPAFLARIERLFPGRDFKAPETARRKHGVSSIQYGRGSVLTVDLTNRCNMMCDPCFMDANQVGYVHELDWQQIRGILDDSLTIKPRRQLSVQFSGGEPTLSAHFLEAIRYARQIGYFSVQCASNGIAFAQDFELCKQAREAGLRLCYLQFDGVSNAANAHRKIGNLFDVKLRAIDNLYRAGIDVALAITVVRGINDAQVGPIVEFAIENAEKITVVSFQPVSFTGRDETIDDERRHAQRYTLSQLARDLKSQLGFIEPLRDWFPLSALNPVSNLVDTLLGDATPFGALNCGCHPNCGIGTVLLVNKRTKVVVPLSQLLDLEQLLVDLDTVADARGSRAQLLARVGLALLRNFKPQHCPPGYGLFELVRQFLSQSGAGGKRIGDTEGDAPTFEWRCLFVAGMWFQDLFNYDFRRTEMCIIPYATEEGEISFCAYNTGVGWRQVVESMHKTASVAEWFKLHGKHPVHAKGRHLPLDERAPATFSDPQPRHLPVVSAS